MEKRFLSLWPLNWLWQSLAPSPKRFPSPSGSLSSCRQIPRRLGKGLLSRTQNLRHESNRPPSRSSPRSLHSDDERLGYPHTAPSSALRYQEYCRSASSSPAPLKSV